MTTVRAVIRLLRPEQWLKNAFVFAALVFGGRLFDGGAVLRVVVAFVAFSALASAAYAWNDWWDRASDARHPEKRHRPLPSGALRPRTALSAAGSLLALGLWLSILLGPAFSAVAVAYVVLQTLYSAWLKKVVIVDVMALALGFVFRAAAGAVVIPVDISPWLIICTYLVALLLGFGKRRHEIVFLEKGATEHRAILVEYDPYFLDQMISVVTASTVVAYSIYTVSPEVREKLGTDAFYLTVPFVLYGIFRYLYLVHRREMGGNPTQLVVMDPSLRGNVALWLLTAVALLYF